MPFNDQENPRTGQPSDAEQHPEHDPTPAAPAAVMPPDRSADDDPDTTTWPLTIVCRDDGAIAVLHPASEREPTTARGALVIVLVDRAGRVRSAHCTCPLYGRERTCAHMWGASFELASYARISPMSNNAAAGA
jgi:hypothetical protein